MVKKLDLGALLEEHTKEFPIETSQGLIVLGHINSLEYSDLVAEIVEDNPDFTKTANDIQTLAKQMNYDQAPKEVLRARIKKLTNQVKPLLDRVRLLTFKEPKLESVEQLEAILKNVTINERDQILAITNKLTAPLPEIDINIAILKLCKDFGIPLVKDNLTAQNLTMHQAEALIKANRPSEV